MGEPSATGRRASPVPATSFPRFAVVAFMGLLLNALIMLIGTGPLSLNYLIAQLGATAIVPFWNFMVNLKWSF